MKPRGLMVAVTVAALVASACSSTAQSVRSAESAEDAVPVQPNTAAEAPTTTAGPVTTAASRIETRPEILSLALPTFGGGSFDPNSVAGQNVLLWFWGAN